MQAETTAGDPAASEHLAAAAELTTDAGQRAQTLRELARTRVAQGDHAGARHAYTSALSALNGDDVELSWLAY